LYIILNTDLLLCADNDSRVDELSSNVGDNVEVESSMRQLEECDGKNK